MMEGGGKEENEQIGIKEPEDVLRCLELGDSAYRLHEAYGERIDGVLASALDALWARYKQLQVEATTERLAGAAAGVIRQALTEEPVLRKSGIIRRIGGPDGMED